MKHDARIHKRFLDYRDRHEYFGKTHGPDGAAQIRLVAYEEFAKLDAEHDALEAKGEDGRDDEEEARWVELSHLLFRD
jgi:hypothetical protein